MRLKLSRFPTGISFLYVVAVCFAVAPLPDARASDTFAAFGFMGGVPTGGEDLSVTEGNYGVKGVPSKQNNPGARDSAITWKDASGRLWLFGGKSKLPERQGVFNDVWMFEPSSRAWTWVAGSKQTNVEPVLGPEGEFGPDYTPGDLISANHWTDQHGNLWLYGGNNRENALFERHGYMANGNMWMFDIAKKQWGLIKQEQQLSAELGTRGVASPDNHPGARQWGSTWVDADGKFWLFGGWGFRGTHNFKFGGDACDLWMYDPSTRLWTWVNGAAGNDNLGYYYDMYGFPTDYRKDPPIGSNPSVREGAQSWIDEEGNFWLFGGRLNRKEQLYYSDLWKYTPSTNTWEFVSGDKREWEDGGVYQNIPPRLTAGVYGRRNVFAATNRPGGRDGAATWTTDDGLLWMFGGYGAAEATGAEGGLADVWKFNPSTKQWAWAGGSKLPYMLGRYGTRNETDSKNYSGGRHSAACWTDNSGKVWIFGGFGFNIFHEDQLNDLWTFEPHNHLWTWVGGNAYPGRLGYYGTPLEPHENNHPGTRQGANLWAPQGNYLFVFGGEGYALQDETSNLNDLWRCDKTTGEWSWVKGVNMLDHPGEYGPKWEPWHSYTPSARRNAAQWNHPFGYLVLFGGQNKKGTLNDLWVFDPSINCWMWISGSSSANSSGRYGTRGIPAQENEPPARHSAATWLDIQGNLWLYGGANAEGETFSDLWKFDVSSFSWVWMHGPDSVNQEAVYGAIGAPAVNNSPGSAFNAIAWSDASGNLWLYGGQERSDMWKYDVAQGRWTWIAGTGSKSVQEPQYTSAGANPGSRFAAAAWADTSGDLWLFGGQTEQDSERNDLWSFSPQTGRWTFVKGKATARQIGSYGSRGSFSNNNLPGARAFAATSIDPQGNMWMYGGKGYDVREGVSRYQGDIWLLNTAQKAAAESWELYE